MQVFLLSEFVSLSTFMIRGLRSQYNISKIGYIFCNKHFTIFDECQMPKDKPNLLFTLEH